MLYNSECSDDKSLCHLTNRDIWSLATAVFDIFCIRILYAITMLKYIRHPHRSIAIVLTAWGNIPPTARDMSIHLGCVFYNYRHQSRQHYRVFRHTSMDTKFMLLRPSFLSASSDWLIDRLAFNLQQDHQYRQRQISLINHAQGSRCNHRIGVNCQTINELELFI